MVAAIAEFVAATRLVDALLALAFATPIADPAEACALAIPAAALACAAEEILDIEAENAIDADEAAEEEAEMMPGVQLQSSVGT